MILRKFSRLPKISRDGFEIIKISENYAGSASANAGSATGIILAIGVGSGDVVRLSVSNVNNIENVEIAFKFSENG